MITATETPDGTVKAAELAEQLRKDYSATVYGVFAALQLAKDAVAANDLPRAATLLEWAQNQNADASLKPLIALRLAKVQFAQGELEKAFASLSGIKDGNAWLVTAAELRGDILQAQNKLDEARESYNAALKALDASGDQEQRANLEIKLSGLAKPGTQP
jgi:predicted negative regulator of RcsB-dependent stress response